MTDNTKHLYPSSEELMQYAKDLGIQSIHTKKDAETGLEAFIVVHNVDRGPAIGGSRFQRYSHPNLALQDAMQLAYRMALKSAAMGLPHGGAKAVIRVPEDRAYDREKLFQSLGEFVNELNGDYITSLDAGTKPEDMDNIIKTTQHVIGATPGHPYNIDPSMYTAYGVFRALQAALECLHGGANLDGIVIAIQGAGHVATHLVNYLHKEGAKIIITDINKARLEPLLALPNIEMVEPNDIYAVDCDIFMPCALGSILNQDTLKMLKCSIICGAANNQLSDNTIAKNLADMNILYLPDFIVNAGGVISASDIYHNTNSDDIYKSVNRIYGITKEILQRAEAEKQLPVQIAIEIAKENLKKQHDQS
jgi:leucine dehydrogenase